MSLPPEALETFEQQIDGILGTYNIAPPTWKVVRGTALQTTEFYYQSQAVQIAVGIRQTNLHFAIAYLTDIGMRYTFLSPPDQAGAQAAAVIEKTFQEGPRL